MATVSLSRFLPSSSTSTSSRRPISRCISHSQLLKPTSPDPILIKPITTTSNRKHNQFHAVVVKATKEEDPPLPDTTTTASAAAATSESEKESESSSSQTEPAKDELTELGAEIQKAMQERENKGEKDFWSGVAEEIGEIEWPAFGKVLGTTGVVIGVIAGSSVVLLTVNAVLAELSDKVFAGRGVQDFFG